MFHAIYKSGPATRARRLVLSAVDRGWFGLTPLKDHIVLCGMPRSGSTLLLLMYEACFGRARTYHKERPALVAADDLRNHAVAISKRPSDIFRTDAIRRRYAGTSTKPRFVVTSRDPRSVLTSVHAAREGYYMTPERWQAFDQQIQRIRHEPDVLTVRFEDLVTAPADVQQRLEQFLDKEFVRAIDSYAESMPAGFMTRALNGVRRLDPATIEKWRLPEHTQRIREVLADVPELPELLIRDGYEEDDQWVLRYR